MFYISTFQTVFLYLPLSLSFWSTRTLPSPQSWQSVGCLNELGGNRHRLGKIKELCNFQHLNIGSQVLNYCWESKKSSSNISLCLIVKLWRTIVYKDHLLYHTQGYLNVPTGPGAESFWKTSLRHTGKCEISIFFFINCKMHFFFSIKTKLSHSKTAAVYVQMTV